MKIINRFYCFIALIAIGITGCEKEEFKEDSLSLQGFAKSTTVANEIISNPYEYDFMIDVINQVKSMSDQYNEDNEYTSGLDINLASKDI